MIWRSTSDFIQRNDDNDNDNESTISDCRVTMHLLCFYCGEGGLVSPDPE